jgi:uncharacterized protein (TIGR02271 family)
MTDEGGEAESVLQGDDPRANHLRTERRRSDGGQNPGRMKEAYGTLTGDEEKKAEGRADRAHLRAENRHHLAWRNEKEVTNMASKSPVHVEPRETGWAVTREGSERASSVYPTQSEAAKEGRELARRDKTEFFLHARDGHIREHRSYGEGSPAAPPGDTGLVGQTGETASTVTGGVVDAAARTVGAAGAAVGSVGNDAGQEADRPGGTIKVTTNKDASDEEISDIEEEYVLTHARYDDASETPEQRYAGYEVYAQDGEKLGKPDDLFVDENDNPEYVGVWTDPLETRSVLIPAEAITVDDASSRMLVSGSKDKVEAGPSLGSGEELTPGLEERVRTYYGLPGPAGITEERGGYGAYYRSEAERAEDPEPSGAAVPGVPPISPGTGDVSRREHDRRGSAEPDAPEEGGEELRVPRSEEELKVGTREREAGAVRVRKRVRTDRERIVVPKKRTEVTVERVPVEGETARSEIGDDEIVVPIIEEEIVIEKRPVVREELRIRKEVVEDTEVIEEDVRREEIEVDDETGRHDT